MINRILDNLDKRFGLVTEFTTGGMYTMQETFSISPKQIARQLKGAKKLRFMVLDGKNSYVVTGVIDDNRYGETVDIVEFKISQYGEVEALKNAEKLAETLDLLLSK